MVSYLKVTPEKRLGQFLASKGFAAPPQPDYDARIFGKVAKSNFPESPYFSIRSISICLFRSLTRTSRVFSIQRYCSRGESFETISCYSQLLNFCSPSNDALEMPSLVKLFGTLRRHRVLRSSASTCVLQVSLHNTMAPCGLRGGSLWEAANRTLRCRVPHLDFFSLRWLSHGASPESSTQRCLCRRVSELGTVKHTITPYLPVMLLPNWKDGNATPDKTPTRKQTGLNNSN